VCVAETRLNKLSSSPSPPSFALFLDRFGYADEILDDKEDLDSTEKYAFTALPTSSSARVLALLGAPID
jgi:hypothetical protein